MAENKEWTEVKKVLIDKRNYLLSKISGKQPVEESASERDHGDDSDKAAASRELEMNYILNNRERAEIKGIEKALQKIKEGTYGICEMCDEKIGKKRLMVLPLTPYCRDCQSEVEMQSKL